MSLVTSIYNGFLTGTNSQIMKKISGLFLDLAVLMGTFQIMMSGTDYCKYFYNQYILKNMFGIHPSPRKSLEQIKSEELEALKKEDIKKENYIVHNQEDGKEMRVEFVKVQKYSPWHDIDPDTDSASYYNAVIEITVGSKRKFEVATKEDFNSIKPDMQDGKIRMLEYKGDGDESNKFSFNGMPFAYGMIPRTFEDPTHKQKCKVSVIGEEEVKEMELGGDEDPLDIFVLSERKIPMGTVRCKIIGVIHFVDGVEIDYKIVAVDASYQDIDKINEIKDLKQTFAFSCAEAKLMNWLKYYKTVDNNGK